MLRSALGREERVSATEAWLQLVTKPFFTADSGKEEGKSQVRASRKREKDERTHFAPHERQIFGSHSLASFQHSHDLVRHGVPRSTQTHPPLGVLE